MMNRIEELLQYIRALLCWIVILLTLLVCEVVFAEEPTVGEIIAYETLSDWHYIPEGSWRRMSIEDARITWGYYRGFIEPERSWQLGGDIQAITPDLLEMCYVREWLPRPPDDPPPEVIPGEVDWVSQVGMTFRIRVPFDKVVDPARHVWIFDPENYTVLTEPRAVAVEQLDDTTVAVVVEVVLYEQTCQLVVGPTMEPAMEAVMLEPKEVSVDDATD